ncbi:ABC transporter substrate-binding protein [Clostridium fallax]|uniref:Putative hydroxymethylpyrimidine transport system substrate-binding protein n=1 Tax=Clostridium fallax TaxID=1533 RepID=A0A1M4T572_9CLOT|nr:ABC transporter substrate-binding protein [Clostridium fallax]SHE39518.1 putative hydroxymethylpyrimidine transport system substrate-binding protein [Clostridium fallax]SQB22599.1 ABC transporter [Clostridium fallax]
MKNLKYLVMAFILLISLTLVSCNKDDKKVNSKDNLKEVDLVLDWYPNAVHSFIYNAIEKDYYKNEGLKVNIKFPSNSSDPLALTGAGKATLGIYYPQHLINAIANEGVPVKSVGAIIQSQLNVVISLKDQNINRPKDLENKTIGSSGDPLTEAVIKDMIKNDNGDPNGINLVDIGFDIISSMSTKRVNATTGGMVNHEVPVMINKGFDVNYFYPCDYGVPNSYELVFVANNNTIDKNPDIIKKFLKASKKGFDYMKNCPNTSLDLLLNNHQKDNFPLTKEIEEESMNILLPKMENENSKFLSQSSDVWQQNIDWLYDKGFIKNKISVDDVFINVETDQ